VIRADCENGGARGFALSHTSESGMALAAAQVAEFKAQGNAMLPVSAPAGVDEDDWQRAKLLYSLMHANVRKNPIPSMI